MNKITRIVIFTVLYITCISGLSFCEPINIAQLVDDFKNATDLQRTQIVNNNVGKELSASGKVVNVEEYDLFDTTNDVKGEFYRVSTETQKTSGSTPYQVYFMFKDKDKVADITKGENITKDGKIMQINDERLLISVWIFCAELNETDKVLFKQSQTPSATQSLP